MAKIYTGALLGPHGERVGRYVTFEDYQNEIGELRLGVPNLGPREPDNDLVICPNCTCQFRAIPMNVQAESQQLQMALRRYGAHDKDCAWPDHECDCGFSAIKPPDEWVDDLETKEK